MKHNKLKIAFLSIILLIFSCKNFLEVDAPNDSLVQETIFLSDDVATSSVIGMYYSMAGNGFASGSSSSISVLCGLSADEFNSHNTSLTEFHQNQIVPTNSTLSSALYLNPYQQIYTANSVLEGLLAENGITLAVKQQLKGEALFVRAFTYFYLTNLYKQVPLQLTSNYQVMQTASQSSTISVYQQIIADLKMAEGLLTDKYVTIERIRPNLPAVQALLARVYLYNQDWENAEKYSSLVIGKTNMYKLVKLDDVFLKNSLEAIWQLMPTASNNTKEGQLFILQGTPQFVSLNNDFVLNGFETNDRRKTSWIKSFTNSTGTYYYPYKYKVKSSTSVTEYSMVLRLAEQFLIRAEARAQRDNIGAAIDDVDVIRGRAELPLLRIISPGINKQDLLSVISRERKIELFSEWGHRWFDLKRGSTAGKILSPLKPKWQSTDVYYPIPQTEIDRNKNVIQNDGY